MPAVNALRLVGSGGANKAMEAELKRLGRRFGTEPERPKRLDEQTLVYPFSPELAWLCVHYSRTASRVLWDVYESDAPRLEPLYDEFFDYFSETESSWLEDGAGISVRARDTEAFPASRSQIQGTIKNAIVDGRRGAVRLETESPDILFSVRGTGGTLTLSVDLAGRSMHERGYRLDRVAAGLRENLAAQILMLARWNPKKETLIDPMCGSGTFAIEARGMACAAPIWVQGRTPTAHQLSPFQEQSRELKPLFADTTPNIVSFDITRKAVHAARENAKRAGFDDLRFEQSDFREVELDPETSEGGLIVVNPPYGERLEADTNTLYRELGDWWRRVGRGTRFAVIAADRDFEFHFGARARIVKPMANGSIPARLLVFDPPESAAL